MPMKWYEGVNTAELDRFLGAYTNGRKWDDAYYEAGYDNAQWKLMNSKNNITNYIRSDNHLDDNLKGKAVLLTMRHASLNAERQRETDTGGTVKGLVYLAVAKAIHQPGKDHFSVLHEGFLYHLSVTIERPRVVVGARPDPWFVKVTGITKGERVQDETVGGWQVATGKNTAVFHV